MTLAGLRSLLLRSGALAACLLLAEFSHRHGGPAFGGLLALGLVAIGSACLGPLVVASDGMPQRAARLAMLPMMAGLPWLADACGAAGWPASMVWGLHLAVMLLPALLLPRAARALQPRMAIALLLVAGGIALAAWPGVQGLMAGMLLHGAAWSLAAHGTPAAGPARGPQAALAALVLLALGLAIDTCGIGALVLTHAVLALFGIAGLAAECATCLSPSPTTRRPRVSRPRSKAASRSAPTG